MSNQCDSCGRRVESNEEKNRRLRAEFAARAERAEKYIATWPAWKQRLVGRVQQPEDDADE